MTLLDSLKIRIFADGVDADGIPDINARPYIRGLTTNPSLMRKAGVRDYEAFARDILRTVTSKPVSFEVLSDEFPEMRRQALRIASWGGNVYVKIPVTNSRGEPSLPLIRELAAMDVKLNVTAILTADQVRGVAAALNPAVPSMVSVFAGRIADTGRDPMPVMRASRALLEGLPGAELLWASVREVFNIIQAEECGCHIVTVPREILDRAVRFLGMDPTALSIETVKTFARDAASAGHTL